MKKVIRIFAALIVTCIALSSICLADDNYDVSSGNQATTYKSGGTAEAPADDADTSEPDDSHDRSENDAGHGPSDPDDVLIDQSTYKNRPRSE